jgi:hypothetical protein
MNAIQCVLFVVLERFIMQNIHSQNIFPLPFLP